jgi:hypothetical protein
LGKKVGSVDVGEIRQGGWTSAVDDTAQELGLTAATVQRAVEGHRLREEELIHSLMGRLWEAAEYPSQQFEPAWRRWLDERTEMMRAVRCIELSDPDHHALRAVADREQEVHEIVLAVADELCRGRFLDQDDAEALIA